MKPHDSPCPELLVNLLANWTHWCDLLTRPDNNGETGEQRCRFLPPSAPAQKTPLGQFSCLLIDMVPNVLHCYHEHSSSLLKEIYVDGYRFHIFVIFSSSLITNCNKNMQIATRKLPCIYLLDLPII